MKEETIAYIALVIIAFAALCAIADSILFFIVGD